MRKRKCNVLRFAAAGIVLCLGIFVACENPADGDDNTGNNAGNTFVEFKNLEQYKVTVYRDSLRQQEVTEVEANGSEIVAATPSASGTVFYPTFHLDLFDMPGISVPYNAPPIVTTIAENKTTDVPIPKLESIDIGSAFIKVINNSSYSLAIRQGGTEINFLGASSGVINTNQSAVYEVTPGPSSGYSIMHNTITPVAFPANLTEFKRGMIYVFTYNGTSLTLTEEKSVEQAFGFPPAAPENFQIEILSGSSVRITWDAVPGAVSYRGYRATGSDYTLASVMTDASVTITSIVAGNTYYFKISAVNSAGKESAQSTAITILMPPGNVWVSAATTSSVSLAWNVVSEASGYNIYRSASETGTYSKVNTAAVNSTEFTDTGVSAYSAYWYKVSAIVNAVEGLQSIPVSANTGVVVPGSGLDAKLTWLRTNAESNNVYTIEINTDEHIVPQTLDYGGITVTITMSGVGGMRTVNLSAQGTLFTINSGVTLILDNNITLNGRSDNNSPLVKIDRGTMIMNADSKITGNSAYEGCGVLVYGTFTMNGGEISGNNNNGSSGGGVRVYQYYQYYNSQNAIFTMNGGKISGNTAWSGGGVYVDYDSGSTFTMNGGEISGNIATNSGGGVTVGGAPGSSLRGKFTMNGGNISGNTSSNNGGGVAVFGYFYMNGGEISGNTSSNNGGGVFSSIPGFLYMSGGVIYGNNAATELRNMASQGVALFRESSTTAQYGTFSGATFHSSGNLTTADTTIRIVNGNLLTE